MSPSKPWAYGRSATSCAFRASPWPAGFGAILPQRLGQALGLFPETFVCERLKEPLSVFREWDVPVDDRNALGFLCRQMLRELLSMASRLGMGLQELEGELKTETGPVPLDIRLVEPTKTNGILPSSSSCNWSGEPGPAALSQFAGPR